jgi:hypothetical protein
MNPDGERKRPDCLKCAYYRITWNPEFPRACEMFGFKGMTMPSVEVFRAAGRPCPAFRLKEGLK